LLLVCPVTSRDQFAHMPSLRRYGLRKSLGCEGGCADSIQFARSESVIDTTFRALGYLGLGGLLSELVSDENRVSFGQRVESGDTSTQSAAPALACSKADTELLNTTSPRDSRGDRADGIRQRAMLFVASLLEWSVTNVVGQIVMSAEPGNPALSEDMHPWRK